ncbi:UDP-N-acetylglucosamine--N-acetylmuramyl-(pentapeptide) pyrophosphoryl-undecaprenol N-acetylglucosamine transferase [Halobacteriovorax marinus]|uniref:UDP-N-acetylglucosamine--N-acetylmuramyl- (pentapeptide) pyrophosphoryl-undecaprenol N-acetylglucosamine transferase n=1 Tax=Halobacteriovorax marinus TaxID=97084 RepID=UPI003A8E0BE3
MKNIVFTGGGSGGHVMPAITLIKELILREDYTIHYIGGRNSIEKNLVADYDVIYKPIFTGKLRRYFSIENFIDIFKIFLGMIQSFFILLKLPKKTLVFSTGGFVSVPVVVAAKITGKKIYIHEQTSRVGLANKICSKFADKVFVSFEESLKFFPNHKTYFSGYPIRKECFDSELHFENFKGMSLINSTKELLFITGGGNGSLLLNNLIKDELDFLKSKYNIIHQVGKAFIDEYQQLSDESYIPVAFIGEEIVDIMKAASIVISRAGAGTVCELMALEKRSIFIPLKIAQKNEQYHNAMEANKYLGSLVLSEDELKNLNVKTILETFEGCDSHSVITSKKEAREFLVEEIENSLS